MRVRTILILTANPNETNRLRLIDEVKRIKGSPALARNQRQFKVVDLWAVNDVELRQALLDNQPEVVHFAGHGTGDGQGGTGRELIPPGDVGSGGLVFEDVAGKVQLISGNALVSLFGLFSHCVKCVVLNACNSEALANAISRHIGFVVGMKETIGDPAAIEFAGGFYDALFAGEDFDKAVKFGCNAIELKGIPEHLTPILKKKGVTAVTVDPTRSVIEQDFDSRVAEVAKAIHSRLDSIKDGRVRREDDQEVGLLVHVAEELVAGSPPSDQDLSEYLATFLTERRDIEHVGLLVWRVFDLLCSREKKAEARVVGEVVDLMLPLCLPPHILSEAREQLQDHGAALILSSVTKKAGAEMLVAGIFNKNTQWDISSPEPAGQQLVGFEDVPIGDPDRNEESALRDLYAATFYADDKKKGTSPGSGLTAAQMRADLGGRYWSRQLKPKRPSYCVVELAASQADRQNQIKLLSSLAIPHLLFIALKPDGETRRLEAFVIDCLDTRLKWVARGFP